MLTLFFRFLVLIEQIEQIEQIEHRRIAIIVIMYN